MASCSASRPYSRIRRPPCSRQACCKDTVGKLAQRFKQPTLGAVLPGALGPRSLGAANAAATSAVPASARPVAAAAPSACTATAPSAAVTAAAAAAAAAGEKRLREMLAIPDDEPEHVAKLLALGVPRERIAELSATEPKFGPRAGVSDALRLMRAIRHSLQHGTQLERYVGCMEELFAEP